MHELLVPKQVKISEILSKGSLSTNNYKRISIINDRQEVIGVFLDNEEPFKKGIEPGSSAYVENSNQVFIRNSCINSIQFTVQKDKYTYLNPNYYNDSILSNEDVVFCTDANIGDCSLFISDGENALLSSGMIKLNFKDTKYKYYVMAFMKDDYFREQLFAMTPKGATIRHSGDLFLRCKIPVCEEDWIYSLLEALIKNISYAEWICNKKLRQTEKMIDNELMVKQYEYENPSIKRMLELARLDSGIYSDTVFQWKKNVENYKYGSCSLGEYGFELRRGPNLAKRDLGRSIQTDDYRKGYSVLIYPSDISPSGYIERVSYLGARNPIWYLGKGDILFSAEGTIGKTFIVCDDGMHFTTNFHGTIIRAIGEEVSLKKSVFLGLYLNYLRSKGVFDCLAVGANGGSFAVGYWDNISIPLVSETMMDQLEAIYSKEAEINPAVFDSEKIENLGIYQLNYFMIKAKALLRKICNDIKKDDLQDKAYYYDFSK